MGKKPGRTPSYWFSFSFFWAQTEKSIARRRKYKVKEEPGGLPTLVAQSKSYTYHTESYQTTHSYDLLTISVKR
jgi:hypothetical protein